CWMLDYFRRIKDEGKRIKDGDAGCSQKAFGMDAGTKRNLYSVSNMNLSFILYPLSSIQYH
ncbi:MAG: hypothetical protein KDG51_10440, partial [Calditrichaeota bacterium]|nr:hypothetical protein [Calditrichota bacterium]